jgi:hypothetical protein
VFEKERLASGKLLCSKPTRAKESFEILATWKHIQNLNYNERKSRKFATESNKMGIMHTILPFIILFRELFQVNGIVILCCAIQFSIFENTLLYFEVFRANLCIRTVEKKPSTKKSVHLKFCIPIFELYFKYAPFSISLRKDRNVKRRKKRETERV